MSRSCVKAQLPSHEIRKLLIQQDSAPMHVNAFRVTNVDAKVKFGVLGAPNLLAEKEVVLQLQRMHFNIELIVFDLQNGKRGVRHVTWSNGVCQ